MMIRLILFLLRPFRKLVEIVDADFNQFISIIRLKLTIDNRRSKKFNSSGEKETTNGLLNTVLHQLLIGFLFALFLFTVQSRFTFFYLAHIFVMTMMLMMIISEFTSVLFDTSENTIIFPLPVKSNTLSLARITHIFIYLSLMAFSLSIAAIVLSIMKYGILSGLLFVITLFFNSLFSLFLANILYLSVIRLAKGERLKNLLMYFQVVVAIALMLGYQFGLNVANKTLLREMVFPVEWYTFLIPPAFFAGFIESFTLWKFGLRDILFITETVLLPGFMIYLTGKYLTPLFNHKLLDLEQGERIPGRIEKSGGKNPWYRLMMLIFARGSDERAAFRLMWRMSGRERQFLQTLLPAYGYVVIIIILPFLSKQSGPATSASNIKYLMILYSFLFISAILPSAMASGSNSGAGWLFRSLPAASPVSIFKGFINAVFSKFFMPFFIIGSAFVLRYWGFKTLPDIIVALLSVYSFSLIIFLIQDPLFPFSTVKHAGSGAAGATKVIVILVLAGFSGYLHSVLSDLGIFRLILIPFYGGLIFFLNRVVFIRKITWKSVDNVNQV